MSKTTEVMQNALLEIKGLRRANEVLAAKVSVIDVFALALQHREYPQQQLGRVDPVWELERHLEALIQEEKVTERLSGKQKQIHEAAMAQMGANKV